MADSIRRSIQKCALLLLLVLLLAGCGGDAVSDTPALDPEQLATGKRVYDATCAACHGLNGEGQPNWKVPVNGAFPAPPHDGSGHTWHHPDQVLLEVIANGGGLPNSAMPAYAGILTEEERAAVLGYIKTFWGKQERTYQAQMTQQRSD